MVRALLHDQYYCLLAKTTDHLLLDVRRPFSVLRGATLADVKKLGGDWSRYAERVGAVRDWRLQKSSDCLYDTLRGLL